MENKESAVCFSETECYYTLYYHRTPLRYINQNKLLIQKVYPLTGQLIALQHRIETNTGLSYHARKQATARESLTLSPAKSCRQQRCSLLSCKETSQVEERKRENCGRQQKDLHKILGNLYQHTPWNRAELTMEGMCTRLCLPTQCSTTARH